MRITKATHAITTLRVGRREMTKAVFRQVDQVLPLCPPPGSPLYFRGIAWKCRVKDQGTWWAFGDRGGSPVRAPMTHDRADAFELTRVGIAALPHLFIAA